MSLYNVEFYMRDKFIGNIYSMYIITRCTAHNFVFIALYCSPITKLAIIDMNFGVVIWNYS